MLNRNATETKRHQFLVTVEAEDTVAQSKLECNLADSLTWVEGVGDVHIDYQGTIQEESGD